jgi:hypothetical protein
MKWLPWMLRLLNRCKVGRRVWIFAEGCRKQMRTLYCPAPQYIRRTDFDLASAKLRESLNDYYSICIKLLGRVFLITGGK